MAGCASVKPIPESERTFSKVIDVQGYTRDQIFDSSRRWVEANLWEAKDMIETEDRASGTIISNGIIMYPDPSGFHAMLGLHKHVLFKMKLDAQNDKFKVTFSSIRIAHHDDKGGLREEPLTYKGDLEVVKTELLSFGDGILSTITRINGPKDL
ncbi:MAG TPA: DUF4468 domain-containing protein [Deltaproteobacteria bacterium]|nr:DUF4468 domain-containing protein [Deltaproteobacteria bacterium]HQJ07525.1 DUF4468 domain-containing protein [Deltaproteobacteria bacterium]